jgi:thiamine pyrophosphate-dependent acetolactate synthase large subunit-like protein
VINRKLGDEDYVVCEGRDVVYAAKLYLENYSPGHAILVSESAPFGCGFPVALGIKAAKERSRVFLVSDRRNFKYHCREFQTASRYRLGVCSVVLPERIPLDEDEPELAALADSLGVKGISIYEPVEDITDEMISEAVELEAGALLEIRSF